MVSTLPQKWLIIFFCQKAENFVYFIPCDFVQISPACGSNDYQIVSNGNLKYPIGKYIFAVNLPSKLFRATVANTLFDILKYLDYMLPKFEPNCIVQNVRNLSFWTKKKELF